MCIRDRLEAVDSAGSQTLFLHVLTTAAPPISPYRSDIAGQTGAQVALADGRSVLIRFANAGRGGTIDLRAADGSSQYNGTLPTTVTAPPLFAAN